MARSRPIYLDHQATTPVDERVLDAMLPYFRDEFGNAASVSHAFGWRARAAVDDARERLAASVGARPEEIVFTSGATESNNLALLGGARARRAHRDRVITLATEHHAVLDPVAALGRDGWKASVLPVEPDGLLDLARLDEALDEGTSIVSVMAANNEIGVLQSLAEIGARCRAHGAWFHSDAAQAVGKVPIHVEEQSIDLLSSSGHKVYGPKGVGALYVRGRRPRVRLEPLFYGGGHERGLRPGTLPVALIVGLARAVDLCVEEREREARRLSGLRDRLLGLLRAGLDGLVLNGHAERRLPGNLNVSFEGVDGDRLLLALPDIAVSSGSACTSADPRPSHVLAALQRPPALARASLRFGLGRGTTEEEIDRAAERVIQEVRTLRDARRPPR